MTLETRPVSAAAPPEGGGAQTSQATLATAAALHRQGRLAEADALYQDILRGNPRHFDALHLRGVIALQTRRWEEGVALVRDAIALNGSVPEAHDNLGNGLRELHRFDEALASFDRAIALRPGDARLHRNRGSALQSLGRHEEALASFATAFALQPDLEFLPGMLAHTRMTICDWSDLQRDVAALGRPYRAWRNSVVAVSAHRLVGFSPAATQGGRTLCARQVPGERRVAGDRPAPGPCQAARWLFLRRLS